MSSTVSTGTNSFSVTFTRYDVKLHHRLQFLTCKNRDEFSYIEPQISICVWSVCDSTMLLTCLWQRSGLVQLSASQRRTMKTPLLCSTLAPPPKKNTLSSCNCLPVSGTKLKANNRQYDQHFFLRVQSTYIIVKKSHILRMFNLQKNSWIYNRQYQISFITGVNTSNVLIILLADNWRWAGLCRKHVTSFTQICTLYPAS